jgi:hypothetical protein
MTPVVVLTNRRDKYLPNALASLAEHVSGWDELVIVDDTGDDQWRRGLLGEADAVVGVASEPAGYTRAMQTVWRVGRDFGQSAFFLEEDFTFLRPVELRTLQTLLVAYPRLTQIALQRAPWYRTEHRRGLLAAQRRRVDQERSMAGRPATTWRDHGSHIEHDAGFTGNPSLIAAHAFGIDWPDTAWSETAMGDELIEAGFTFAWYGQEGDPPHVAHQGSERAVHSTGY